MGRVLAAGPGFPAPTTESFDYKKLFEFRLFGIDIYLNKATGLVILGALLVGLLFIAAFRKPKLVPRGLQNVMEVMYDFIRNLALETMGTAGLPFVPYLMTLFFFVFTLNVFAVIPFLQFPATSRIAVPIVLAILSWVIFNYVGIKRQGFGPYFRNVIFPPGIPKALYIMVSPLEFFSTLIVRPVTLALRLFANMFAGHLLLLIFFLGTTYLLHPSFTLLFSGVSFIFSIVLVGFELLVDALQAYIFTILTAVYIAGALEPEH